MSQDVERHPCQINQIRIKGIANRIKKGAARHDAALAMGVPDTLFDSWYFLGSQQAEGPYYDLYEAVNEAEGECACLMAQIIAYGAVQQKDWKAAAHWLRHRRPRQWNEKQTEETQPTHVTNNIVVLSLDELRQLPYEELCRRYRTALGEAAETATRSLPPAPDPG